jgi:hypothetical protein
MRGAPQRGFARLISRISCRTSRATLGLPGRRRDFQRQKVRNPARCHRTIVSGRPIVTAARTVGASRYSNIKISRSNALRAGRLGALRRRTFNWCRSAITSRSSEPPRPEEVQQDPAEQIERLGHPAFIARFGRSDQVDGICDRWDSGAGPHSGVLVAALQIDD